MKQDRRRFFKNLGLGAGAVVAAPMLLKGEVEKTLQEMRVTDLIPPEKPSIEISSDFVIVEWGINDDRNMFVDRHGEDIIHTGRRLQTGWIRCYCESADVLDKFASSKPVELVLPAYALPGKFGEPHPPQTGMMFVGKVKFSQMQLEAPARNQDVMVTLDFIAVEPFKAVQV